jgi:ribosomal protein S18 acetylase RimI-like enzyme
MLYIHGLLRVHMNIRPATQTDIPAALTLADIPEFTMTDHKVADQAYFVESLNNIFLVAEEHNEIIGFLIAHNITPSIVYFDLLAVREDQRGKRVGTQLITALEEEFKKRGVHEYFFFVRESQERTLNFYHRLGYQAITKGFLFAKEL